MRQHRVGTMRLSKLAPTAARKWLGAQRLRRARTRNARRPLGEVFTEIYEQAKWGGDRYHSGAGSRGNAADAYVRCIRQLLRTYAIRTVVDVGCGDFHVASGFADDVRSYMGLDVVQELIARNRSRHARPGVEFALADATGGKLPRADLCLIRQVLQHLSNVEISAILDNCSQYPLVLITEHQPAALLATAPNVD